MQKFISSSGDKCVTCGYISLYSVGKFSGLTFTPSCGVAFLGGFSVAYSASPYRSNDDDFGDYCHLGEITQTMEHSALMHSFGIEFL